MPCECATAETQYTKDKSAAGTRDDYKQFV